MCKPNDGHFHEDFEDEPSVEERFPDDGRFDEDLRDFEDEDFEDEDFEDDEPDPFHGRDAEADADVLASAGWGTDEDYGDWGLSDAEYGGEG